MSHKHKDQPKPILILEASFYPDIAEKLMDGATRVLEDAMVAYEQLTVPGCFELPAAIAIALKSKRYSGYIALGCVIRGETSHYDYVCSESARGLNQLAIKHRLALGYGIITAENDAQAYARCMPDDRNVGRRAASACLAMLDIKHQFT